MSIDMSTAINTMLEATTVMYRKGEERTEATLGAVHVIEQWIGVDKVPDDLLKIPPEDVQFIDMHFFMVGVNMRAARVWKETLGALLDNWPPDPSYMPENRLANGPSYIELGSQIGTFMGQQDAMRLMALGEALDLWDVITPERLMARVGVQLDDQQARMMAGSGLVMISGYHPD